MSAHKSPHQAPAGSDARMGTGNCRTGFAIVSGEEEGGSSGTQMRQLDSNYSVN